MFISPMLCNSVKRPELASKDWSGYIIEPKYDGARSIIDITDDGVEIYSRTGKKFTDHLPHLVDELSRFPSGTTLDGEIALLERSEDISGVEVPFSNFNTTMRVLGSSSRRGVSLQDNQYGHLSLICYDVIRRDGEDVMGHRLKERRKMVDDLPRDDHIVCSPYWDKGDAESLFDQIVGLDGEGIILKNKSGLYVPGKRPSRNFYKVKVVLEADVIIMGANPGKGKYEGMVGSINFGRWDDGEVVYVGRCSGMTDGEREWITDNIDDLAGDVMTISYNEKVGSGEYQSPRHPQFLRMRDDKDPSSCDGYEFKNVSTR